MFIDFDRTLFDTDLLYEWIGENRIEKLMKLTSGELISPDFSQYLYSDTLEFLRWASTTHQLVLLTYTINVTLQDKKISGSGVAQFFDEVIMVTGEDGDFSGKGTAAKNYLLKTGVRGLEHVFLDDSPQNIDEVKQKNPEIRCIRIDRVVHAQGMLHDAFLSPDHVVRDLNELRSIL